MSGLKQTVEDQRQGAVTVASTVAKALDKALPYLTLAPLADPVRRGLYDWGSGEVPLRVLAARGIYARLVSAACQRGNAGK